MHGYIAVGCWALRAPEQVTAQPDVACNAGLHHPRLPPIGDTTMPRLTFGAWLFVVALLAALGASTWFLVALLTA